MMGDSELVARQLSGAYKVKHPAMRPLYLEATAALGQFDRWQIRTVPRAQNARPTGSSTRRSTARAPAAR